MFKYSLTIHIQYISYFGYIILQIKHYVCDMRLISILLLFSLNSCTVIKLSDSEVANQDLLSYKKTIAIESQTPSSLFLKVNSWFVKQFNSAKSVIQYSDKTEGVVIGKFSTTFNYKNVIYDANQIITVRINDKTIVMTISDPYYKLSSDEYYDKLIYKDGLKLVRVGWIKMGITLEEELSNSTL